MGLISRGLGGPAAVSALGDAAANLAQVFTPNATRRMELSAEAHRAALSEHSEEFANGREGWFDRFVNGLNRLPRPILALGTLGLFVFAMVDPVAFAERMAGLDYVPEPLWWLLGAIVSFYFGARELHYFRTPRQRDFDRRTVMREADLSADAVASAAPNPALERYLQDLREQGAED